MTEQRKEYVKGLRDLADWYEAHPEIELPYEPVHDNYAVNSKEDAASVIRALGRCDKEYSGNLLTISRQFGPIKAKFVFYREAVCRKVVVGTREVPEQVIPAQPEEVIPAHVEEITKWECEPILATEKEAEAV